LEKKSIPNAVKKNLPRKTGEETKLDCNIRKGHPPHFLAEEEWTRRLATKAGWRFDLQLGKGEKSLKKKGGKREIGSSPNRRWGCDSKDGERVS